MGAACDAQAGGLCGQPQAAVPPLARNPCGAPPWRAQAGAGDTAADSRRHCCPTNAGAWTSCPTNSPTAAASASWPSWTTAPRVPGAGGGQLVIRPARGAGAGRPYPPARAAGDDRQRQRHGVHLQRYPRVGGSDGYRLALHPARPSRTVSLKALTAAACATSCSTRRSSTLPNSRPRHAAGLAVRLQRIVLKNSA